MESYESKGILKTISRNSKEIPEEIYGITTNVSELIQIQFRMSLIEIQKKSNGNPEELQSTSGSHL